ncbi:DNA-processing protein DprA [Dokdonia genika]|uniref:DNA-processing protein DprA n=1 Tax=Dokdonia genika TaxID=308113 RepID=A0ABV9LAT4_9FLAO
MNNSIKHILALSLIKGVGDAFIKKKLNEIELYSNDINLLGNMLGGKVTINAITDNFPKALSIIEECTENNIIIIPITSSQYPFLLKEIKNPPAVLYLKGNIDNLERCVAVIGSRKSDSLGNTIASKIGDYFSKKWSICNGLVDGIDKNTILNNECVLSNVTGVLSGGLNFDKTSSKVTKELAAKVLENNGLLVSENPPNKREDQFSGSKASRIQAGLSKGIILIQSSTKGGSKYTIKAFSETSRVLGVINFKSNESFLNDELFSGNRLLVSKGNEGIATMCEIKKIKNIKVKEVISLMRKEDYIVFEAALNNDF